MHWMERRWDWIFIVCIFVVFRLPILPAGDEYTCLKFTVQINNSAEVSIPSLTNWKYFFSLKGDTAR